MHERKKEPSFLVYYQWRYSRNGVLSQITPPRDDLRQDKFGYISASGCGRAIEFFGSQLTVECPILAGHHEFRRKVKEVFQKNLKCVSSHHELRYYVYVLSVMHSVF